MDNTDSGENLLIDEIRLILEEKRTSLSMLRTGIFILITQLLIIAVMIAASQFYKMLEILHMAIPFYIINLALFVLACYFIVYALSRIRRYDATISQLKKRHFRINEILS